jgi:hypothetical protein
MGSTKYFLPPAFWFRLSLRCPRVDSIPRSGESLLTLPDTCLIPDFEQLEGTTPWSSIRLGWNPKGLGISVEVRDKLGPIKRNVLEPEYGDSVQVWIDTRDTRDIHRASRFCHRFFAILDQPIKSQPPTVELSQRTLHRALTDAPRCDLKLIQSRVETIRKGWRLELFFPAEVLNGFDPETNRRLGFMIQVTDPHRGDHFLGVGREFPISEDPSLWATLELTDTP